MVGQSAKNVIYLIADSVRPDYLGCYGSEKTLTTEIDKLAREGVQFEHTVSAAPWTIPSVKSHATGKYPHNIDIFDSDVSDGPTVFDQFKNEGYETALYYDSERRTELFSDSVDHYDWSYDLESMLEFISGHKDEPFFVFNLYRGTHLPYTLKYSSEAWHRAKDELMDRIRHDGEEGIEEAKYRYARSIERFSEWYVGAILDRLRKEELLEDTAIIITSDHGECWGERFDDQTQVDLFDLHGTFLYNETLMVPLILYNVGIDRTENVDEMVRSVDVLPTVLDAFGMSPVRDNLDGQSLLDCLEGQGGDYPELAFSSTTTHDQFGGIGEGGEGSGATFNRFSVYRQDGWKYILSTDIEQRELYDTSTDPEETTNLADKETDITTNLDQVVQNEFGSLIERRGHSDEVKDHLKDLGYL